MGKYCDMYNEMKNMVANKLVYTQSFRVIQNGNGINKDITYRSLQGC